jgi:glycosyltransferase involved in cell wall biosynthesis
VCSYHGWAVNGSGRPVSIPQATHDGPAVERAALASPRACVKAYPTREADGLVFVWGDPASPALADATPTPGNPALRALPPGAVTATTNQWFVRDFPVPHDELVGNLLSQDHVPFAHSGVASSRHSPFAAHFEVTALNAARDAAGAVDGVSFDLEWAPDARKLVKQRVTCVPPAYIEYLTPADDEDNTQKTGEASGGAAGSSARRPAGLKNVLFQDEIHPDEIPGLYAQCQVGLVALDPRHKSHNIPGKFLTYMQSGLPVLANINAGNDLAGIIRHENVGRVSEDGSADTLAQLALELMDSLGVDDGYRARCRATYSRLFAPETAVKQIVAAFGKDNESEH